MLGMRRRTKTRRKKRTKRRRKRRIKVDGGVGKLRRFFSRRRVGGSG